ncbi:MAG: ABC transporter permease [Anaerolineales bacterium]|jgi:ABC-2 type transport system permease protein
MNWRIVSTLVVKDLSLFFRNRFLAVISVLMLVAYSVIYYLMPSSVDEVVEFGYLGPPLPPSIMEEMEREEGLILHQVSSQEALAQAVSGGLYDLGIALPSDLSAQLGAGERPQGWVYFPSDFPSELKEAYTILIQELVFTMSGQTLNIEFNEVILGRDLAGMQIPVRERLLPLIAVFALVMETMGLASLISAEIEGRTLQALLVTPMRVEGLFLGKGIAGVGLSAFQAALLMAVTGGLSQQPALILTTLLLAGLLVTGIGFLLASWGKDLMSVMGWGVFAILILSIPAIGVIFPGTLTGWVKVIPSYYLVDTIYQAANFNQGWEANWDNLLILLAYAAAILGLGIIVLRRKFQ